MSERAILAQRRESERFSFWHDQHKFTATFSWFRNGEIAEVFLNVDGAAGKSGTALESMMRDAAILTSLALQHGVSVDVLRHSLTRLEKDEPAGAICRFLDVIALRRGCMINW